MAPAAAISPAHALSALLHSLLSSPCSLPVLSYPYMLSSGVSEMPLPFPIPCELWQEEGDGVHHALC